MSALVSDDCRVKLHHHCNRRIRCECVCHGRSGVSEWRKAQPKPLKRATMVPTLLPTATRLYCPVCGGEPGRDLRRYCSLDCLLAGG